MVANSNPPVDVRVRLNGRVVAAFLTLAVGGTGAAMVLPSGGQWDKVASTAAQAGPWAVLTLCLVLWIARDYRGRVAAYQKEVADVRADWSRDREQLVDELRAAVSDAARVREQRTEDLRAALSELHETSMAVSAAMTEASKEIRELRGTLERRGLV